MKKLASILLLKTFAIVATAANSQAGRNKRGWYQKRPGANCVMRKVTTTNASGQVVVQKVRVCS